MWRPNALTGRFLRRFGLKTGIDFSHFGLESGMIFEETTVVSIPNEYETEEWYANSQWK